MPDSVDAAIAAAAQPPPPADMMTVNVTIQSTGRVIGIAFPKDASDGEVLEFVGWTGTVLLQSLRAWRAANAGPQLEVARSMPQVVGPRRR